MPGCLIAAADPAGAIVPVTAFGLFAGRGAVAAPFIGSTPISFARVRPRFHFADNVDAQIFFVARLPRVLAAALVGGTLAAAGVVFQALLRNPLATPYTLGVSAGAALGAMLAITFRHGLRGRRRRCRWRAWPVARRGRHRVCAGDGAPPRPVDHGAAARRRDAQCVLFRADPVRAVPQRFRADIPRAPLADG